MRYRLRYELSEEAERSQIAMTADLNILWDERGGWVVEAETEIGTVIGKGKTIFLASLNWLVNRMAIG